MPRPPLPPSVRVQPGIDLPAVWEAFERFEALHHLMRIMNPLSSDGLDEVLDHIALAPSSDIVDLACGHGELVARAAADHGCCALGVDLSPWALARAARRADELGVADRVEWLLADAGEVAPTGSRDAAAALGASWVWGGYAGTVAGLAAHVRPGGIVVVGDLYRRPGVTAAEAGEEFGEAPTPEEQEAAFAAAGLEPVGLVDTTAADWHDYQARIQASAEAWAADFPGERAATYLADQRRWAADHADAAELIGWNVRIGRRR